jgi:hypothetical protein
MSGVNEILESGQWIRQQIEANTTLQAYADKVPDDVPLPAVRFSPQMPRDTRTIGNNPRILTKIDWLVAVVKSGLGLVDLVPLANAVDAALENQSGSTAAVLILACQRLEPFSLLETDRTGADFRHAGGIYRTTVQLV